MVGSLDVSALYPSLDHEGASEQVSKLVMRSTVELSGMDWRAAQTFLASNLTEDEIKFEGLQKLVPRRLKKRGRRPGATTEEIWVKHRTPQDTPGGDVEDVGGSGGACPPTRAGLAPLPRGSNKSTSYKEEMVDKRQVGSNRHLQTI